MNDTPFRVAVLDDFEQIADTVPAYGKLKARADVALFRDRLDTSERIVAALRDFDAGVHLKTAGTTWLEEAIGLAAAGGGSCGSGARRWKPG